MTRVIRSQLEWHALLKPSTRLGPDPAAKPLVLFEIVVATSEAAGAAMSGRANVGDFRMLSLALRHLSCYNVLPRRLSR